MNDTIDHLQQATLRLSQEGSLKDRLIEAYTEHLAEIDPSRCPSACAPISSPCIRRCTAPVPLPRECVIRASVRKMSIAEVRAYAALVVRAFAALARGDVGAQATRNVPSRLGPRHPVVSLFAEA